MDLSPKGTLLLEHCCKRYRRLLYLSPIYTLVAIYAYRRSLDLSPQHRLVTALLLRIRATEGHWTSVINAHLLLHCCDRYRSMDLSPQHTLVTALLLLSMDLSPHLTLAIALLLLVRATKGHWASVINTRLLLHCCYCQRTSVLTSHLLGLQKATGPQSSTHVGYCTVDNRRPLDLINKLKPACRCVDLPRGEKKWVFKKTNYIPQNGRTNGAQTDENTCFHEVTNPSTRRPIFR